MDRDINAGYHGYHQTYKIYIMVTRCKHYVSWTAWTQIMCIVDMGHEKFISWILSVSIVYLRYHQ